MTVYLIYKDDAWHTKGSGKLLRVADNLQKCYATAEANGASEEQLKDLHNIGQSQCSGKSYEFNIETWEVT